MGVDTQFPSPWIPSLPFRNYKPTLLLEQQDLRAYPGESEGATEVYDPDTGVVSKEASSCGIGWCSKNLETNSKLWGKNKEKPNLGKTQKFHNVKRTRKKTS